MGIGLHVYFPSYIWHAWDCIWFFSIMTWVLSGVTMFFSLAFPFPDSFDEMGFYIWFMWDRRIGFEVEWGGSPNGQTHCLVASKLYCGSQTPLA